MMNAAQFARAALLAAEHWPRLCPQSAVSWELKARRTPFGEESYLSMDAVPAEVLGCRGIVAPAGASTALGGESSAGSRVGKRCDLEEDDEACLSLAPPRADQEQLPPGQASGPPRLPAAAASAASGAAASDAAEAQNTAAGFPLPAALRGSCPPCQQLQQQRQRLYDVHVVFHQSYRVPCLFLRGYLVDGQPLEAAEMAADFPQWGEYALMAGCSWAFMAPEVHPVLQQLGWLMLHPCTTAELMQLLLDERQQRGGSEGHIPLGDDSSTSVCGTGTARDQHSQGRVVLAGPCGLCSVGLQRRGEEEDVGEVPDIDEVLVGELEEPAVPSPAQEGRRGGSIGLGAAASDAHLLRYLEAWLRLVCPVVGLKMPLPVSGSQQ